MRPRLLIVLAGLGAAFVVGQAHAATPGDPFEATNRRLYNGGVSADRKYFLPLARLYHKLTPGPIGVVIHNVITNLSEPVVIANDVLQARMNQAAHDTVRLILNSSFGLLGAADVATPSGLPHHDNDFGITLGRWGVRPGPYLYLPFLGPSTVRDAIGVGADSVMAPLNFIRFPGRLTLDVSSQVAGAFDKRLRAEPELEALLSGAADPYATLRSVYLQSREAEIRGESAAPVLAPIGETTAPAGTAVDASAYVQAPPVLAAAAEPVATPAAQTAETQPPAAQPPGAAADPGDPDGVIATARPFDIDGSPASVLHGS